MFTRSHMALLGTLGIGFVFGALFGLPLAVITMTTGPRPLHSNLDVLFAAGFVALPALWGTVVALIVWIVMSRPSLPGRSRWLFSIVVGIVCGVLTELGTFGHVNGVLGTIGGIEGALLYVLMHRQLERAK